MDETGYKFLYDPRYCYIDSNVLINKLNITDQDELDTAEKEITSLEIAEAEINYIKGNFNTQHLKDIHLKIFSSIYSWAGKIRTVDIAKGALFCKSEYIDNELGRIFNELADEKYLIFTLTQDVPKRLSYYLGELNAIHLFREGNGRTQRLFIEYLGYIIGYDVDFSHIQSEDMLKASIETFNCKYDTMINIFQKALNPISYSTRIEIAAEICIDKSIIEYLNKL